MCSSDLPPAVPGGITASDGTFTEKVAVSWGNVTGEDSFEVYRCSNADDTDSCSLTGSTEANVLNFDDTGANPQGTVHYYRVRACHNVNGCSAYSTADAGNRAITPLPDLIMTDGFEEPDPP